jgi:putative glutamine amidotransferase
MIMYRPLIGVTTQTLQAIEGVPDELPPSVVMNQRYHLAVAKAGGVPVLVPLIPDDIGTLREIYERLDGILLPGGVDVDPATYGHAPHEKLGTVDPPRDRTELQLASWAIEDGKPLLGVCRGIQVLNVACGGTLFQDIGAEIEGASKHDCFPLEGFTRDHIAHDVEIDAGSKLASVMGVSRLAVNSLHHQSIRDLGEGLTATAHSPDGVVEAVERAGAPFVLGVQWHPEAFDPPAAATAALFREFVIEAGARGSGLKISD